MKNIQRYRLRIFPVTKLQSIATLPKELPAYDVQVFPVELPDISGQLSILYEFLSHEEQERAKRFHFYKDANLFVAAHGLLRVILAHYLGVSPLTILFTTRSGGKPILAQTLQTQSISFNISHSGETVLIGVSSIAEIGVDVESVRPFDNFVEIAENFFHPEETLAILAVPENMRLYKFYEIWTMKEAVVKALGTGLTCSLKHFNVSSVGDSWKKIHFSNSFNKLTLYERNIKTSLQWQGAVSIYTP